MPTSSRLLGRWTFSLCVALLLGYIYIQSFVRARSELTMSGLRYLTVLATAKHTATVIIAHGLGDTGHGWQPVAQMLSRDPKLAHIKWILPHSPSIPVTLNMGMKMPAWFDITSLDGLTAKEDTKGMLESASSLNSLIASEISSSGIQADRIVLGGFSQGAAMAVLTGLTRKEGPLAGIVSLSGWLVLRDQIKDMLVPHATSLPIFWANGKADTVVAYEYGEKSVGYLTSKLGLKPTNGEAIHGILFKSYEGMGHEASPEELKDLHEWLAKVLPQSVAAKV